MSLEQDVGDYVKLRDLKAEMKSAYEASVADLNTGMMKLENAMMATLNEQGVESVRTNAGTAFKSFSTSATVADWDIFIKFVRENDRWDLVEKRCSKLAVEHYLAENNELPPGVNWKSEVYINVRRRTSEDFPVLSVDDSGFVLLKNGLKTKLGQSNGATVNLKLVVVRVNKYFQGIHTAGNGEAGVVKPSCYSADGLAPAIDSINPQSSDCQSCPRSIKSMKPSGLGAENYCSSMPRLAVASLDAIGQPWLLSLHADAFSNFAAAVRVVDSRKLPYNGVVFMVTVSHESSYPKLSFKPIDLIAEAVHEKICASYEFYDVRDMLGLLTCRPSSEVGFQEPLVDVGELDAAIQAKQSSLLSSHDESQSENTSVLGILPTAANAKLEAMQLLRT